jgi:hypothetical protein
MALTHEHVHHLVKRNDSLMSKVEKLKSRGAALTKHGVQILEVSAGAALGGLLQGAMKDPHVARVPVDLAVGIGLNAAALLDLAGHEYSHHLANLGTGFIAAYASEKGFEIGLRKKTTGSFFGPKISALPPPPPMPAMPAPVAASGDAAATAAALLNAQRAAQGY